jgi:hypothetical protein
VIGWAGQPGEQPDLKKPDGFGVGLGDDHAGDLGSAGFDGDGEGSRTPRTVPSSESSPTNRQPGVFFFRETALGADDAQGQGEVESGTFLF